MEKKEFKGMLEFIVPRLIKMIILEMKTDEKKAFTLLYRSELYRQLEREGTKLWHLSVLTLYEMLCEELQTGKITYPEEA